MGAAPGRELCIPLRYGETETGALVAVAVRPERKQWWRTFVDGERARLTVRGRQVDVRGVVIDGGERDAALRAYLDRYPRSTRITEGAAVVVFEARDG